MATERNLARARRGAAWLDQKLGRGWRRWIRRKNLDMGSGSYMVGDCGCILAQIDAHHQAGADYGYYTRAVEELGITNPVRLGFVMDGRSSFSRRSEEYDDLTEAWREVLREPAA